MPGQSPISLEYAKPADAGPLPPWVLRVAVLCGVMPMVCGIVIVALYRLTWWRELEKAAVVCIGGGLLLFAIGAAALTWYATVAKSRGMKATWTVPAIAALLLLNFPVCLACIRVGVQAKSIFRVVVINEGRTALKDVKIIDHVAGLGSATFERQQIAPGERFSQDVSLALSSESVEVSAKVDGVPSSTVVARNIGGGQGPLIREVRFRPPSTMPAVSNP